MSDQDRVTCPECQELRERYDRAVQEFFTETNAAKKAAYDYWAKVHAEDVAALQRVRNALIGHGIHKKNIPVAVIQRAIDGEATHG